MTIGIRVGYPGERPLMEAPAQGCYGCPCIAVCARLQADEEVLCELSDAAVGIGRYAPETTRSWLNMTHEEVRQEDPWFDFPNRAEV